MTLKILKFPDPILGETMPQFDFNNPIMDPKELEKSLIETMLSNRGIGLAANQVGIKTSVFTIGHSENPETAQAFFNPVIVKTSKEFNDMVEGCLSFPGIYAKIKRPAVIHAKWQNSDGVWQEDELDGYNAKCFCHEYDHLHAIVMKDRVSQIRWALAVKKSHKIGKK